MTVQRAHERARNTRTAPKQRLRDWLTVDRPPMVRTQRRDPGGWRTETYGPLPSMGTVRDRRFSDGTPRRTR